MTRIDVFRRREKVLRSRYEMTQFEIETGEIALSLEAENTLRQEVKPEIRYLHVQQFEAFAEYAQGLGA